MTQHTRRGLFQMIGAAIAARRVNRALKHYVAVDLAAGQPFTIAGFYAVNPPTREATDVHREFRFHFDAIVPCIKEEDRAA